MWLPRGRPTRFALRAAVLCLALAGALRGSAGCRRPTPASADVEDYANPPDPAVRSWPASPLEAARLLRSWHAARRYTWLASAVEPQRAPLFIDTLIAVDRLLQANEDLCDAVRTRLGEHRVRRWNMDYMRNQLGLFSADVTLLREDVDGDEAVVTFQVAQRVPLGEAHFAYRRGRWWYRPDPGAAELPGILSELADVLHSIARRIRRDNLPPEEIDREFRLRVGPVLRRVLEMAGEPAPAAEPDSPSP